MEDRWYKPKKSASLSGSVILNYKSLANILQGHLFVWNINFLLHISNKRTLSFTLEDKNEDY